MVGKVKFEARIKELVENLPDLAELVEPLLIVRRALREQLVILHRRLLTIVRDDEVCRRLMTTPGVGPVVALTYRATVDVPARFRKSKAVGAVFGLTCSKYQSGEIDRSGRISRCGDEMMRVMLYEAAQSMLRSKKWSWLKAWAMQIARRRGMKKAIVALARRLAVIMHRIWVDGALGAGSPGGFQPDVGAAANDDNGLADQFRYALGGYNTGCWAHDSSGQQSLSKQPRSRSSHHCNGLSLSIIVGINSDTVG
jgi:Transposase IS116/IS110/IS902 family